MPIIRAGLAMLLILTLLDAAQARHHGHHGSVPRSAEDLLGDPGVPGPVGAMMAQFIRACGLQIAELKNFPIDTIAASTTPDTSQNNALDEARQAAAAAADKLAMGCPQDMPTDPAMRLQSMEHGVDAVEAALNAVQPPLQAFYALLSGDQKRRLDARFLDAGLAATAASPVAETTGISSRAASRRSRRRENENDGPKPIPASAAPAKEWDCAQWEAELRTWPLRREEQAMMIGPRQRAAFYEFAAAMQHAADTLADSCPAEIAATPIGRIGELLKKLEAVRKSAVIIAPALGHFYQILDGEQKSHFDAAI